MTEIVLASGSPYRRAQLEQLRINFEWITPSIDEAAEPNEDAQQLVRRLSRQKAEAVADLYQHHLIIGSDQVATLDGATLTKPGNFSNAVQQLNQCSGRVVTFYTGLYVWSGASARGESRIATTDVRFRHLNHRQIENYLIREEPYDCAGSFMCEGLGISLFESISSDDPSALVGLPLISLTALLAQFGLDPLGD